MPLVDPVYQIKVNPLDGFRRSWDPQGVFSANLVERANLGLDGQLVKLDKAKLFTSNNLSIVSKEIDLISDVIIVLPVIASINSNQDVLVGQQNVEIAGAAFGTTPGSVTLNGSSLTIVNWSVAEDLITVNWPDIPFDASFGSTLLGTQYEVVVTRADAEQDNRSVITNEATGDYFGVITSTPTNGLYGNDTDVEAGDYGYIRITGGTADSVDVGTGIVDGLSLGATVQYAIYDTSLQAWAF